MKMKAVLFDCDGLMFDTERVAQDMWREIGRSFGVEIPDDLFVAITGVKDTRALTPYFETVPHLQDILDGDMVEHGKPDPDIFLLGASILGVDPENCLVLEDSKMGILAAKRAGMHSCFIQDTIKPDDEMRENIEFEKEDLLQVIDLLEELQ